VSRKGGKKVLSEKGTCKKEPEVVQLATRGCGCGAEEGGGICSKKRVGATFYLADSLLLVQKPVI
jgi:hypothetical protein